MNSEKELKNKSYVQCDYNCGEYFLERKQIGGMGKKITKSSHAEREASALKQKLTLLVLGENGNFDGFLSFLFLYSFFKSFYISVREGLLFQGKLKGFGVRQHSHNC